MKVRNSRSRISLGHMKHRSGVRANSYFSSIALVAFLCLSCLSTSSPIAAQARAKTGKSRGHAGRVQTGLDVLEAEKFAPLRGKHVGLITNHTPARLSGAHDDQRPRPRARRAGRGPLSPEHGIAGHSDEKLSSSKDASTGLPIFSL